MTNIESQKQDQLKNEKPYVYEKCMRFPEMVKQGKSIAIIQFQYNYICNFKCEHCCIQVFQTQAHTKKSFTIDDVKNLSKQADEYGLAHFVITGGEPLTFKDYDALVAAIDPNKFYITSDTNGWFLTKDRAKHLKNIGIDKIQLSIDSLDEIAHDEFRRKPGSHKKCLEAIDAAQEANLNIIIQTVVTKQRLHSDEFVNFVKFLNNKNVGVFVTFAKPVGAWQGKTNMLIDENDMAYMKTLEQKYNVFTHLTPAYGFNHGCIAVKRMISVTQYGDVMPCPYIHTSLGNVFTEPLKDIIDRGMKIKYFGQFADTCWIAMDRNFIKNYVEDKIDGKNLPVPYTEVFDKETDWIK